MFSLFGFQFEFKSLHSQINDLRDELEDFIFRAVLADAAKKMVDGGSFLPFAKATANYDNQTLRLMGIRSGSALLGFLQMAEEVEARTAGGADKDRQSEIYLLEKRDESRLKRFPEEQPGLMQKAFEECRDFFCGPRKKTFVQKLDGSLAHYFLDVAGEACMKRKKLGAWVPVGVSPETLHAAVVRRRAELGLT